MDLWKFQDDISHKPIEITIVYPATIDWYLLYQRPQQLLTSFAKIPGVRSIFVSSESYRKLPHPITKLAEDLFVVSSYVDYDPLVRGKKVLWFSYPPHFTYANQKRFDAVVFDALDNPADEFAFWKEHLPQAVQRADAIACTANILYEYHKDAGKPVFMCPNGADYEHFKIARNPLPAPHDFPKKKEGDIVVGFYGAMASWVDYEVILKIAQKYKVVMIGHNKYYYAYLDHPNVTNLPHKDYSELPYYLAQFDVAMIPFKLTDMIKGCDPIKFYEYLAGGKPVVATDMVELRKFSDVTYFIDKWNCHDVIKQAVAEDSEEKRDQRQVVAQLHSWDARAKTAIEVIRNLF